MWLTNLKKRQLMLSFDTRLVIKLSLVPVKVIHSSKCRIRKRFIKIFECKIKEKIVKFAILSKFNVNFETFNVNKINLNVLVVIFWFKKY